MRDRRQTPEFRTWSTSTFIVFSDDHITDVVAGKIDGKILGEKVLA
jgi:hypothetical protein